MSQTDQGNPNRQERLQVALVEYLEGFESGNLQDRDAFLARYPDIASELSEFLANHEQIEEVALPLRNAVHKHNQSPAINQPTLPLDSSDAQVGTKVRYFGNYEIMEEIARGGMGVIYKARQSTLKRIVALKMILSGHMASEDAVKRFYVEAESAAKLDHPGIVPIFEIGHHEGQHYFSMAFVEGKNLAHKIVEGPMAPREAAELIKKVAEAVAYALIEGVVHRDLKPANVLIDKDGEPRVTDFGLAKQIATEYMTETGEDTAPKLTESRF